MLTWLNYNLIIINLETLARTIKLFSDNKYCLTTSEQVDLQHRLITKSYYLYELVIAFLKNNNFVINYTNVKNLIKLEIRIRNDLRNLMTALEEAIWNKYIWELEKTGKKINLKLIGKTISLNKMIKFLEMTELDEIRIIRNEVSHLVYYITFQKITKLISSLKKIKKFNFIVDKKIEETIKKMEANKKTLGFSTLKWIKKD